MRMALPDYCRAFDFLAYHPASAPNWGASSSPNAFRKFKLAENQWEDTTPLGLVIIGEFTQGSSQARNPGLNDGIPLGLGMGISERH